MFPWYHHRATLWCEFERIQKEARIHLECREKHEHTSRCHVYGFHDFRRAFATMNADMLSPNALRKLMRHRSDSTTKRYINMADKLKPAVETCMCRKCWLQGGEVDSGLQPTGRQPII